MTNAYTSFTGADMLAVIKVQNAEPYILGSLSDLTLSTHRPAYEVLALGFQSARGFTRGPRVVAGSLVFVMFNSHLMYNISRFLSTNSYISADKSREEVQLILAYDEHEDELPLFDIIINYINECNVASHMIIYGVQLVDSQTSQGVNVVAPNIRYSFVAIDYKPMTPGVFDHTSFNTKWRRPHGEEEAL